MGEKPVKELGHTEIENDTMVVGSYGSWRIIYTVGRRGIEVGGALKIMFFERDVWNSLQNDDPITEGYVSVTTSGKCKLEVRVFNHFMKKEVIVKVREERLNPGETIAVTFGDKSKGCPGISVGRNNTAKGYVWETFVDVRGESNTPPKLWNLLRDKEAFTIPHHTGLQLDSGTSGTDWDYHDDEMQPLVEIYSKWGSSEFYGSTRPLTRRIERNRRGGFVQDALARGYKLGFTGGSDIHNARPGAQHQSMFYKRSGLTAVFAHTLTRQDIFYALRNRRCYATTGDRTILYFYVNGHFMGEEFTVPSGETPREIQVEVHACREI